MNRNRRITGKPITLASILLLSSALAAPAFAQIEEVVVTAQKKSEDIQTVPIAVTAFTSEDLAAHQIVQFKDLQFSEPSITYTKTAFTSTNFQIRGVGTQVIAGDQESGVAFNIDDAFYAAAPVDSGQFYDIDRVEVLRGPQSTLYGRGATGGTVNVFTNKPQLDTMAADIDASYGNYNAWEVKGMVNMPLIPDKLGLRIAADKLSRDGWTTNIFPGASDHHVDSRDQWSIRASARWQPTDATTVDFTFQHGKEDDTRMRGQKQLCHTDPTGVLGCLPDALSAEPVNVNSTFFNIPISKQAMGTTFGPVYDAAYPSPPYPAGTGTAIAEGLGLVDLQAPFCSPASVCAPNGVVPSDPHKINTDFTPTMKGESNSFTTEWKQRITNWLDSTLVVNTATGNNKSQESYTNFPTPNFNPTLLATSLATVQSTLNSFVTEGLVPASYADPINGPYAFILNPANFPTLPVSSVKHLGIIGGDIERYAPNELAYDQSSGQTRQRELDFRLNTDFDGPLNAMVAFFYLNTVSSGDYYVASNALDYGQTLLGAIGAPATLGGDLLAGITPPNYLVQCAQVGCIYATPYYDNRTEAAKLDSRAVYGEVYYDIVPGELKLTLGGRYTEDTKKDIGRISIFNGLVPIGTNSNDAAMDYVTSTGQADFDPNVAGNQPFYYVRTKFDKLTGRAVLDWTPKLDFTDYTLVYTSFAKGYKAGGANPGVQAGNGIGLPLTYKPEAIDAYEVGTKNTLLGGALQANGDIWYYDYKDYQISEIISNTSINTNINVKLWGAEASAVWQPDSHWAINFSADFTHSGIDNGVTAVDPRNPGAGDPNAIVIKDGQLTTTNAQNCVYYYKGDGVLSTGNMDTDFASMAANAPTVFFAPPGGMHQLTGSGVPNVAFGSCYAGTDPTSLFYKLSVNDPAGVGGLLAAYGFHTSDPSVNGSLTGEPVSLKGNHIANTPTTAFSLGVQYTADLDDGYTLVPRVDFYWHGDMWGRIFKDPADKIKAATEVNAQLTLNSPNNVWYAQAFVKNLFDKDNITGEYLTSSSSGLWTGTFYTDPRTFGVAVGARF